MSVPSRAGQASSYRYIVHRPGVRGGHAIVEGTRIGVHDVVGLLQNGETVDSILVSCFRISLKHKSTNALLTTKTTATRSIF